MAAMPEWKRHGVLAFTINLQGGSPGFAGRTWPRRRRGCAGCSRRCGCRTLVRPRSPATAPAAPRSRQPRPPHLPPNAAERRRPAPPEARVEAVAEVPRDRSSKTVRSIRRAISGRRTWRVCKRILDRADELGMVAIVGYFYFGQDQRLKDEAAVSRARPQCHELDPRRRISQRPRRGEQRMQHLVRPRNPDSQRGCLN